MSEITKLSNRATAEEVIGNLDLDDLRFLNKIIVERINYLVRFRRGIRLLQFSPGDRVQFTSKYGDVIEGTVIRVNRKTVSVSTGENEGWWNVSPELLTKI